MILNASQLLEKQIQGDFDVDFFHAIHCCMSGCKKYLANFVHVQQSGFLKNKGFQSAKVFSEAVRHLGISVSSSFLCHHQRICY